MHVMSKFKLYFLPLILLAELKDLQKVSIQAFSMCSSKKYRYLWQKNHKYLWFLAMQSLSCRNIFKLYDEIFSASWLDLFPGNYVQVYLTIDSRKKTRNFRISTKYVVLSSTRYQATWKRDWKSRSTADILVS